MILGGHVSAAGGVLKALTRAQELEFEAIQIHPSAPQAWRPPNVSPDDADLFKKTYQEYGVQSGFFHNIYLANFAAPDPEHWQNSIKITQTYLTLADTMGIKGVVTHTGSHKGNGLDSCLERVIEGIHQSLANSPSGSAYLIENTAGGGGSIGRTLEEIEQIFAPLQSQHQNIGICIDTCHAFAAGIPIHTADGLESFLTEFESRFGLQSLFCIHLNDSKTEFGSQKDRHENIGDGFLGLEAVARIINHPKLKTTPFLMEVPGLDKQGPDAPNRDRVRSLVR